jgi:hypothetical protein
MTRRSGLTLVEVLVAIFVMGIGMIALLTLFPIGVLQMAQAIRQDRCLRAALAADTISVLPLGSDALVGGNPTSLRYDAVMATNAFANPLNLYELDRSYFTQPIAAMPVANPYGPSYAVMVDPHGVLATAGLIAKLRPWVGALAPAVNPTGATGGLVRRPVSFANNVQINIKQWFSLPDDVVFDNDPFPGSPLPGTPKLVAPTTMMRDTPFSWTYVLQRPRAGDSSVVNCTIVVFENRPLLLAALTPNNQNQLPEFVFGGGTKAAPVVQFITSSNTIQIISAVQPNLRAGDWLYDATIILPDKTHPFPEVASAFYRVVAVDETALNTYSYQVQQPLRPLARDPQRNQYPNTVIVMEGVSEVFERGPARVP